MQVLVRNTLSADRKYILLSINALVSLPNYEINLNAASGFYILQDNAL